MNVDQKILSTFNKYFYDFIEDLQAINEDLKKVIVDTFQVRQMKTDKNLLFLIDTIDKETYKELTSTTDATKLFKKTPVGQIKLFQNMSLLDLASMTESSHHPIMLHYVYVLVLLATIYTFKSDESMSEKDRLEIVDELFTNAMAVFCGIESGEDYSMALSNIYDTNILGMLIALGNLKKEKDTAPLENENENESGDPFMEKMKNVLQGSKIGQFTNEIMAEMTTEMKDDMKDVTNIEDFMKSGKVGNVINKTVQYFDKKNKSGEFTQEDIMKECANLMGIFGNTMPFNPPSASASSTPSPSPSPSSPSSPPSFNMSDIQNIMKLFSGEDKFKLNQSTLQNQNQSQETRNRLRKKLESKK